MYFYIFGRKINYIVIKQSTKQKIRKVKKKKEKDNNVDTRSQDCFQRILPSSFNVLKSN